MARISGSVAYTSTYVLQTSTIPNVPVVIQDVSSGVGIVVLSNSLGFYQVDSIPAGDYRVVEAWGTTGGVASPADFTNAASISAPTPLDPIPSAVPAAPAGATYIGSVTPNTFFVAVTTPNVTVTFIDAAYVENPIIPKGITYTSGNLFTAANNGNWGTLPNGTSVETRPATEPYPIVTGFTYVSPPANIANANDYTVSNIFTFAGIFADHTSRDETGRAAYINGGNQGAVYYSEIVTVQPNSYYQISNWLLNMTGPALPVVGYRVKTTGGTTLFSNDITALPAFEPRIWQEIGTIFNSGNNTALNMQFVSQGTGAAGNDFVVDDMGLFQVSITDSITAEKTVNKTTAKIGDTLDYTIVLTNTGTPTIDTIIFKDTIPNGTTFNTGTVRINGTTVPAANPANFTMPTPPMPMSSNEVITVTYKVTVSTLPSINPIPNSANISYVFTPISGGATVPNATNTNIVTTEIGNINLGPVSKVASESFGTIGDTITYTITFKNSGVTTATNVIFSDTIPISTTFISNSLVINGITQGGLSPNPPGVTIPNVGPGESITINFNVIVNSIPTTNSVTNQGNISFLDLGNTIATNLISNSTTTTLSFLTLNSTKSVNKTFAKVGDTLTYNIVISNIGNVTASNVVFIDTIPNDTTLVANTLTQDSTPIAGSPNPPGVTLPNEIKPLGVTTITFNLLVTTIPNPNPIPNSAVATSIFTIDVTTIPTRVGTAATATNIVNTQINSASLRGITKTVDKVFVTCGENITYTVILPNSGNVTAFNVIVRDTIPNGTVLDPTSIFINGSVQVGANLITGVTIPSIAPGATATLTFSVKVTC